MITLLVIILSGIGLTIVGGILSVSWVVWAIIGIVEALAWLDATVFKSLFHHNHKSKKGEPLKK